MAYPPEAAPDSEVINEPGTRKPTGKRHPEDTIRPARDKEVRER